ncbi:conserved hypothetical protein [Arthrobacter sp. 9V]|uniref:hypothetical protein n=1 Tax=Micrococcales TaxID=85006 RepID=UPI0012EFDF9F|nr:MULTISPECIES: hypothetical protein [Micrococcales]VXB96768.1 conserved hypothetical protein [Curtobacterium sp. 8I-2]VXC74844.1 conserved hypothetical protein [Arthrobacter sp. 9V]
MTPIPTEWDITHTCGHTVRKNLSNKPAGQRAGTARWFAKNRQCPACEAEQRAAEDAEFRAEAERDGMPELIGNDGAVRWAVRIRQEFLRASFRELVETNLVDAAVFQRDVLEAARRVTAARWWIDNREIAAADLPELLAEPGPGAIARTRPPAGPGAASSEPAPAAGRVSFFDKKANR